MASSSNFDFLKEHDPVFTQLGAAAERAFSGDPNTTLIKLRQLAEALAQDLAARSGIGFDENTRQADLLFKLNREIRLDPTIRDLFHTLRIEGSRATHQFETQHKEAMNGLRIARELAIWFHQSFGKQGESFKAGAFILPQDPSKHLNELHTQIEQLKANLTDTSQQLESNQKLTDLVAREKEEYAVLAEQMDAEARIYEQLATEHEQALTQQRQTFEKRLKEMQALLTHQENRQEKDSQQQARQKKAKRKVSENTQKATAQFTLNEELTRFIIDQQLINAGWDADTQDLTHKKITGASDKVKQLIRRYKNETCHLVFLRRVRSRILYEQMIGRATRRYDEIGKTVFKIYDPVDIFAVLEEVSIMKPLVKDPNVTIEQLVKELTDPKSFEAPGSQPQTSHAHDVLDDLSQKVMRVLRKATKKQKNNHL